MTKSKEELATEYSHRFDKGNKFNTTNSGDAYFEELAFLADMWRPLKMENEKKVAKDYWFIEDRLYSCDCVSGEPIKTDPCFKVIHCKEVLPSQESGVCPACGTEFELESFTRCKELLLSELDQLRKLKKQAIEVVGFYSKCDGFCADEECVCETKTANAFLEKWGEK